MHNATYHPRHSPPHPPLSTPPPTSRRLKTQTSRSPTLPISSSTTFSLSNGEARIRQRESPLWHSPRSEPLRVHKRRPLRLRHHRSPQRIRLPALQRPQIGACADDNRVRALVCGECS